MIPKSYLGATLFTAHFTKSPFPLYVAAVDYADACAIARAHVGEVPSRIEVVLGISNNLFISEDALKLFTSFAGESNAPPPQAKAATDPGLSLYAVRASRDGRVEGYFVRGNASPAPDISAFIDPSWYFTSVDEAFERISPRSKEWPRLDAVRVVVGVAARVVDEESAS